MGDVPMTRDEAGAAALEALAELDFEDVAPSDDAPATGEPEADNHPFESKEGGPESKAPAPADSAAADGDTDEQGSDEPERDAPADDLDAEIAALEAEWKGEARKDARDAELEELRQKVAFLESLSASRTEAQREPERPVPVKPPTRNALPELPPLDEETATDFEIQQYRFMQAVRDHALQQQARADHYEGQIAEARRQAQVAAIRNEAQTAMDRYADVFGDEAPLREAASLAFADRLSSTQEPAHLIAAKVAKQYRGIVEKIRGGYVQEKVKQSTARTGARGGGAKQGNDAAKRSFNAKDLRDGNIRDAVFEELRHLDFSDMKP